MLFAGPLAGWMGGRLGSKAPLLIGTATAAAAFGLLAAFHDQRWHIYLGTFLMGVGIGFSFASMANLIVEAVDQTQTGVATGMNTIARTIGGSVGGQLTASIVAGSTVVGTSLAAESGFVDAFRLSALGLVAAFLATLAIPGRRSRLVSSAHHADREIRPALDAHQAQP
jgi:MFS family permease